MVTNSFENRDFMRPMKRLSMHSRVRVLNTIFSFDFLRGGSGDSLFFLLFPSSSHQVPQLFPRILTNGHLNFIPDCLQLPQIYNVQRGRGCKSEAYIGFYLGE
jgi:hypothetical protein